MPRNTPPHFRKTLLALAASAALTPCGAWALDLAQSPPGSTEPYVAPNVIISIDDSGSMDTQVTSSYTGDSTIVAPNADGSWPDKAKRINILKYSLKQVFTDTSLLPDKKIRIAWQVLHNGGNSPDAKNVNSTSMNQNSMRVLEGAHRTNFLNFVNNLKASGNTPSHLMFSQADGYLRRNLGTNSAWASNPGTTDKPYLGCRRAYHIFMSDGRWNSSPTGGAQDDATNKTLPDGMVYGGTTAADQQKSALYRDTDPDNLADWAFYSWATPLQPSGMTGTMQAAADYRKAPATENFGTDPTNGKSAILDRYWNPRYNPATWSHLVTYTIGFSTDATTWPGASSIIAPTQKVPFSYDNSFIRLVTGSQTWPAMDNENKRALDLWHAALNGRGRFYAVMKGEDLEKAFREIVGQINTATAPELTSTATSGANNTFNDVGKYTGAYEPTNAWKGFVTAETVKKDGTTVPDPSWGGKNTAEKLDALYPSSAASRLVLSWSDEWVTSKHKGGVPFKWANDQTNLSTAQKAMLGLAPTDTGVTVKTNGQNQLNYIRGDRGLEGSDSTGYTPAKPFRERKSIQGDIINSMVWYTGAPASNYALKGYAAFTLANATRPPMIYVGGNDGMLHGFTANASTPTGTDGGAEKIAYVPRGVIPTLPQFTDPVFNDKHKFFVDGSPMTGDVDLGTGDPVDPTYTPNWRTLLVGALGAGGKGYFVLDVTDPASGFTETNAGTLVKLDRTRGSSEAAPNCTAMTGAEKTACDNAVEEDKDIGHITARPVLNESNPMRTTQITRMNNNRWAVVMGNGYNSANQRPVLLIQYLDGTQELQRIPVTTAAAGTGNAKDNGLSAPRLMDLNGDGSPDIAYAGDNLGNMWKFDLTNVSEANWKVALGGSPLFTATGPTALGSASRPNIQPITIAPTVRANDRTDCEVVSGTCKANTDVAVGGMMVAFGTGRNVAVKDPESDKVQTLYSVLDNTRYRIVNTAKGKRLEVHPGGGTCPGKTCVPAPSPLGEGVTIAKLAEQKITELNGGDYGTVDVKDTMNDLKKGTWSNFNGWYLDLPAVGERLLKPMEFYDGSNILTVYSQVPAKGSNVDPDVESCESTSVDEERQYRTLVNIMDGKRPRVQVVDKNGDGVYNASDDNVSRVKVSKGSHTLITQKDKITDIDAKNNKELLARMPEQSLRPSWRQVK